MGVEGLWPVLEQVGHPIKIEALEGKRLGVDANIWLYKFIRGFREKDNAQSIDSHKLGLFNRICKLLFYRIKPVFVFDGPAPVLKRRTLERRQNVRSKQLAKVQDTAMRLIAQQLKDQYPNANLDEVTITLPELRSHGLVAAEKLTDEDRELFYLPPEVIGVDSSEKDDDEDEPEVLELKQERKPRLDELEISLEDYGEGVRDVDYKPPIDIESQEFKEMPAEVRYQILTDLKESRRRIRRAHALPEDANSFSKLQLERLRSRRAVQEKIEQSEKDICSMYTGYETSTNQLGKAFRMQSDATSTMIYLKNTSNEPTPPVSQTSQDTNTYSSKEEPFSPLKAAPIRISPNKKATPENQVIRIFPKRFKRNYQEKEVAEVNLSDHSDASDEECLELPQKHIQPPKERVEVPKEKEHPKNIEKTNIIQQEQKEESCSEYEEKEDTNENMNAASAKEDIVYHIDSESDDDLEEVNIEPPKPSENDDTLIIDSDMEEKDGHINKLGDQLDDKLGDEAAKKNDTVYIIDSSDESDKSESESKVNRDGDRTIWTDSFAEFDQIVSKLPKEIHEESISDEPKTSSSQNNINNRLPTTTFPEEDKQVSHSQPVASERNEPKPRENTLSVAQALETDINLDSEAKRLTNRVTTKIVDEAKELLKLFGIPYIDAAGEAEAQCALLEELKLTEGTITDDSDVWLFGAKNVLRYFFSDDKFVMRYEMKEIEHHLRLNRELLVCFAMLVGSDYTDGIMNVGPVTALEILAEFPGDGMDPLVKFKNWKQKYEKSKDRVPGSKKRENLLKYRLPEDFPSRAVFEGYTRPVADTSTESFTWGTPVLDELREYARRNFGWDMRKIDDKLLPVMKKVSETKTQTTIDSFFFKTAANVNPELFRSKRVNKALGKISKVKEEDEVVLTEEEDEGDSEKQPKKQLKADGPSKTKSKRAKTKKSTTSTKQKKVDKKRTTKEKT